jgi:release factor glutamine methyltransferase
VTVHEALQLATARLRSAGVDSPEHDAEALLRHVLRWERARLIAEGRASLGEDDERSYLDLVEERARRRPLQHLTGTQWFWKHEFKVTPDVLVPRRETELLVEVALDLLRDVKRPRVVDVGTGSGCIALSLAAERPDAEVHATDISEPALAVARENADRLGLHSPVAFRHGDLLEPVGALGGRLDLILSNPPYVSKAELHGLSPEVRRHDPHQALIPPGDRLSVYRRLAPAAARLLRPGGALAVEIGQGMEDEVSRLIEDAGLRVERILPDLAGIPRVVIARAGSPGAGPLLF